MSTYLNGDIYINGLKIITDEMDLTELSTKLDYLVIIGVIFICLLVLDLIRRIFSKQTKK